MRNVNSLCHCCHDQRPSFKSRLSGLLYCTACWHRVGWPTEVDSAISSVLSKDRKAEILAMLKQEFTKAREYNIFDGYQEEVLKGIVMRVVAQLYNPDALNVDSPFYI